MNWEFFFSDIGDWKKALPQQQTKPNSLSIPNVRSYSGFSLIWPNGLFSEGFIIVSRYKEESQVQKYFSQTFRQCYRSILSEQTAKNCYVLKYLKYLKS